MYTKRECEYGPGEWPRECSTCAHYRGLTREYGNCIIILPKENDLEEEMVCKFHVMKKN